MSNLHLEIPHQLAQEEALRRIKNMLGDVKRDHADKISDLEETWNGNEGSFRFTARGFPVSGAIAVHKDSVHLDGNLPFAVSLFKDAISKMIREKATDLLK